MGEQPVVPGVPPEVDKTEVVEEPLGEDVHPDPAELEALIEAERALASEPDEVEVVDGPPDDDATGIVARGIEERRARRGDA